MSANNSITCLKIMLIVLAQITWLQAASAHANEEHAAKSDQAVTAYLTLRHSGKNHFQALTKVRAEFQVAEDELEAAAIRLSQAGAPLPDSDSKRDPARQ